MTNLIKLRARCLAALFLFLCTPRLPAQALSKDARIERGRQFLGLAPPPDPAAAARGQKLFAQTCGFCHGPNANGAEGPNLIRSTVVLHDEKGELIAPVILKGRPDRGMPSFSALDPEQISDIAAFLHARVEAAANRYSYQLLNVVTGNAKAGEAFFNGTGHCRQCHSSTGDLAHVAAKFAAPDLQAQFLYPANSQSVQTTVTVTLASGDSITGKLKLLDDFNVSLWDSSGEYRSFSRTSVKVQLHDPLEAHRELLDHYSNTDMHDVLAYLETLK